ncbi:POTRA domain-containing protein, partial [Raoultella planticola]|uniref:POTRA domain-containing protein n=1 Tax=Raoultella planticola TaxID=575 RepID=UPI003D03842B
MLQIRQLCITSLLLVSGVASAASVRLQVEGLSGELEKNVRAQLSTIQSDEVTPDRRFRARVDDAIREGLKALGYYEPTIYAIGAYGLALGYQYLGLGFWAMLPTGAIMAAL